MRRSDKKLDLSGLQGLCSSNYLRLLRLLPDGQDGFCYAISPLNNKIGDSLLTLDTLQNTSYTSLLKLEYKATETGCSEIMQLQVRSYHDAKMSEVVSCNKRRNFELYYEYPNPQMYHSDEKWQLNEMLSQWLKHCKTHGRSVEPFEQSWLNSASSL